jgi:sec-independent protein translocase protein TatA
MPGLGSIGMPELLIVLVIIIIIFGVGKLPEIGGALGKGIREFRTAQQGLDSDDKSAEAPEEKKEEEKES